MFECLILFLCIKSSSIDADKFLDDTMRNNIESLELFLTKLPKRKPKPGYGGDDGELPLAAVSIIKEFEGFAPRAAPDGLKGGKPYTAGWGATEREDGSEWRLGEKITREEADALLLKQLHRDYLPPLKTIPGWKYMEPHQKAALLSFSYNLGAYFYGRKDFRTITSVLRHRQYSRKIILRTFLMYRNPGSGVEGGLYYRRMAEAKLFLTGHAHTVMPLEI